MSATPILSVQGLKKSFRSNWTFKEIQAVHDLSFDVFPGEMFGFLGHNGAGKTTSLKCILGLVRKTAGRILLNGEELTTSEQRRSIGYLPELPYFYEHLSVFETLQFLGSLYGKWGRKQDLDTNVVQTLERVGLSEKIHAPVHSLSKGLQQRLGLAQAIIHTPSLLLLDEPFSGLDPIGRHQFKEIITELRANGCTVILSSHVLSDIERLCDRVSIMNQGRLQQIFSIGEMPTLFGEESHLTFIGTADHRSLLVQAATITSRPHPQGEEFIAKFKNRSDGEAALQRILDSKLIVHEYRVAAPTLEEVFVRLTKEGR